MGAAGQHVSHAALCAPEGQTLGAFRWILCECEPVSKLAENTAWQEFSVETAPANP